MRQLFFTILALFILSNTYAQVKATSAEINTGTDDDKFATALALQGSKYVDQNGAKISAVTAAGANTYTANIVPAIIAYSSGQVFYIKITTANTGASTLNLNSLGAKTLVKDASTALVAGDLLAGKVYSVYYDGTNFQVMNGGVIGNNTGDQTLSLATGAGNIAISNGNSVSLRSLWAGVVTDYPDGNVKPSTPGVYPYLTTTGSTNYPTADGGGIKFTRNSGNTQGHFEFYKAANNLNDVYFRGGTGTTTFGDWDIIAGKNWANAQFYTRSQTDAGFLKIGTTGGYAAADPNVDLNTVTTNNVFYIGSASTNAPTSGGGMIQSLGRNSVYSAQTMLANNPDSWFYRSQNNGVWSTWNQVASRAWATANFAPLSGAGNFISKMGHDTFNGTLAPLSATALDAGLYGNYAPVRLGHIWSIGSSFSINPNGADFGNVYGMTYQFTGSGGNVTGGTKALSHQIAFSANGINGASIGLAGNIWNNGWFRGPNGLVGSPTYSFINSPTTGMYSAGADALGFSAAGLLKMSVTPTSIVNHTNVVNNTLSQRMWDPATTVTGSRSFYDITYYNNGTAAPSGGLRVDLPITNSTMWVARITMMEYDTTTPTNAKTTDLIITGYAISNVNFSVLCNAPDRIAQVRIGRNAANTKTVLMIATNDGTLKYLKSNLKEFTVYHTAHTAAAFEDPGQYKMSLATDDTDYVHTRTVLNSGFVRDSYGLNYNNLSNKPVLGNTVLKAGDTMTGSLTVSSTANPKLILQQSAVNQINNIDFRNEAGASIGTIGKWASTTNDLAINTTSVGGNLSLAVGGALKMAITPTALTSTVPFSGTSAAFSGLVQASSIGIGTTNVHSYKLAVGGGIIAESVKIKPQGSWPDYVFEKDYPILPLNELEKFVLKNKHLPDVPNAAEVKKDGIDVGEMNAKLLQKIEELTLYLIDQQKGMITQQKEIKDLKTNELRLSKEIEKLSAEMNLLKNK